MHAYEVSPHRSSHRSSFSATPIYDSLYAEWIKAFRTLPGDHSGEEEWEFVPFGLAPHGTGTHGVYGPHGTYGSGAYGTPPHASNSYSAYSAGAYSARHATGQLQPQWQRVGTIGRQHTGMQHVPAALPPAPRRGL
ncbi:hypothetical protein [Streptomyces sp. NPDC086787]|uniref:hypothetical protein n=1 Tax=Streptomyces sp. NPDC086787 TaxID=3365759 RepID=UPI0037F435F2